MQKDSISRPARPLLFFAWFALTGLLGCHANPTHHYWVQVTNPTHEWVAAAETIPGSAIRSTETTTTVYLYNIVPGGSGNIPPQPIATLYGRNTSDDQFTHAKLTWPEPLHLDVSYSDGNLGLQTAAYSTVVISTHGSGALTVQIPPASKDAPYLNSRPE